MKHLSAFLFAGFFCLAAHAQDGFYFSPSAGVGIGNSRSSVYHTEDGYRNWNYKDPVFTCNMQLGIGYQYKNWRFQTGIQYFRSGHKVKDLVFEKDFDPRNTQTGYGSYEISINQVAIPLQIGYAIPLGRRLSLTPYAGLLSSFTFSGKYRHNLYGHRSDGNLSGASLNDYGRFTFWGLAGLQLEYKLNDKVSLFGGPSVQYMLGSTGNKFDNGFYNINVNLGAKINLGKGLKISAGSTAK